MSKKLTPELTKEYLDSFGTECPFCNTENIQAGSWDIGVGEFWQNVICHSCGKEWTDIYTLTGIEEEEEETE